MSMSMSAMSARSQSSEESDLFHKGGICWVDEMAGFGPGERLVCRELDLVLRASLCMRDRGGVNKSLMFVATNGRHTYARTYGASLKRRTDGSQMLTRSISEEYVIPASPAYRAFHIPDVRIPDPCFNHKMQCNNFSF